MPYLIDLSKPILAQSGWVHHISYMVTYKSHGGDDAVSAAGLSDQQVLLGLLNHLMHRLGLFVSVGAGANTEGKVQRLLGKLKRQLASDFL